MKKTAQVAQCNKCGADYKRYLFQIEKGTGNFCSQSCYLEHRWAENKSCKVCGSVCTGKQQKFCSPVCRDDYWNKIYPKIHKKPQIWQRKIDLIKSLGGKCCECGFDDIRALHIDHIDPSKKKKEKFGGYNWNRRFKDWANNAGNLRILCANCHSVHTWVQRGFGHESMNISGC